MSRSSKSSFLASLFSNLQNTALTLCPQEVVALPVAEYLGESTYLLISRSTAYHLYNYTGGRGCKSCLLRPACNGRIETPDGSLVLNPDPRKCHHEAGLHNNQTEYSFGVNVYTYWRDSRAEPGLEVQKGVQGGGAPRLVKGARNELDSYQKTKLMRNWKSPALLRNHSRSDLRPFTGKKWHTR